MEGRLLILEKDFLFGCIFLARDNAAPPQAVRRAFQRVAAVAPGFGLVTVVEFQGEPFQILLVGFQRAAYPRKHGEGELTVFFPAQALTGHFQKVGGVGET